MLTELYVTQRLSTPDIGRLLGIPDRRVRDRLRRYGRSPFLRRLAASPVRERVSGDPFHTVS